MDLDQALLTHAEWKTRFREAVNKQESMDVETISRDNCCELGKWLHGDGRNRYGKLSIFQTCVHRHAIFHREAGKIAQMINLHQYQQAELAMQEGDYAVASSAVSVAIMQLRQETAANSPK